MQDFANLRKQNQERVNGFIEDDNRSKVVKITPEMLKDDAELSWHIIAQATKKKTERIKINDNNYKTKVLNERAYPELVENKVIGRVKAESGKGIKNRYNVATMREMYTFRNKIISYIIGDIDDTFTNCYIDMISPLDDYAEKAVLSMYADNDKLFDQIYEIDLREEEELKERMRKARENRNK